MLLSSKTHLPRRHLTNPLSPNYSATFRPVAMPRTAETELQCARVVARSTDTRVLTACTQAIEAVY